MTLFYNREGKPILDTLEWGRLFENLDYKRVAEDTLDDGTWISTVWIGIDQDIGFSDRPMIFETMVFPGRCTETCEKPRFKANSIGVCNHLRELDVDRYSTEAEALRGHRKMLMKWRSKVKMALH